MPLRARCSTRSRRGCVPTCRALVDGVRIIRDGKVYLRKQCPRARAVGGADLRRRRLVPALADLHQGGLGPAEALDEGRGRAVPKDCGLCPDHEQHSCLPIIEITNHCNLECPICIVQNRNNYNMSAAEFAGTIDGLVEKEGLLDTVNLSGGEPTMHPRFSRAPRHGGDARRSRASRSRPTACASRATSGFCRELAARKVYVNLQLDALRNPAAARRCAAPAIITRSRCARSTTSSARACGRRSSSTVAKGVNDDQIGDCIRLLFERDFILSLMFQPASYTGLRRRAFRAARSAERHHDPRCRPRRRGADGRAAAEDGLPAAAVLAPGLLRADVSAQDRRGLHPVPALHRSRAVSRDHRQPRHHPPRRAVRGRDSRHDRRAVVERRPESRQRADPADAAEGASAACIRRIARSSSRSGCTSARGW